MTGDSRKDFDPSPSAPGVGFASWRAGFDLRHRPAAGWPGALPAPPRPRSAKRGRTPRQPPQSLVSVPRQLSAEDTGNLAPGPWRSSGPVGTGRATALGDPALARKAGPSPPGQRFLRPSEKPTTLKIAGEWMHGSPRKTEPFSSTWMTRSVNGTDTNGIKLSRNLLF